MRIPFDLIAAILCSERIGDYLSQRRGAEPNALHALWVWPLFLLITYMLNDVIARLTDRRMDYGRAPDGGGLGLHPQQFHTRCTRAAQVLTVALYAAIIWQLQWPLVVERWPEWIGLSEGASVGGLVLARSTVISALLTLGPFLAAMMLSWIPRRRLMPVARRRQVPLLAFLSLEAKLSLLPLSLGAALAVLSDLFLMSSNLVPKLPPEVVDFFSNELTQAVLLCVLSGLAITIFVPMAVVKLWHCTPLPDGELKERLRALTEKSGVKARAIMVWGKRNTGMLNAGVLGPWSRFRYVLISPLLVDELSVDETEAVLAHELGHARYGHLTFYVAVIAMLAILIASLDSAIGTGWRAFPLAQVGATMAFVIGYLYFVFGALSRRCEREADLASAEMIGTPLPLISALEKIAARYGNIRNVPCWHHGSIADRILAVERLSLNPDESMRFHARLRAMRIGLMVLAVALLAVQMIWHG